MFVVAISVGFIFSQPVPPTIDVISQNTILALQENTQNSTTQTLEPLEDLITDSAHGKLTPQENIEDTNILTSPNSLENLTFSAKDKETITNSNQYPITDNTKENTNTNTNATAKTIEETLDPKKPMPKEELSQTQEPKQVKEKKVLITKSELQPKKGVATIINAELRMDGDQVTLLVKGDRNINAKSFILEKPNRVVFDIKDTWLISIPRVTSNRMVKDIRLGKTDTHTRLVFDLKIKPSKTQVEQISPDSVQLIFK